LRPLAHWSFDAEPAKFLVAAGGAILARPRLPVRRRLLTFVAGIVVFLVSLYIYDQVSTRPPSEASLASYDLAGYVSFFFTYLSFGFCIAYIWLSLIAPPAGDVHGRLTALPAGPEPRPDAERRDTRLIVVVPAIAGGFTHWAPLLDRLRREPALDGTRWVKWNHKRGKLSVVSAARLANSLKAAIDEQWIAHGPFDEVVLVGHSLGGLLVRSAYLLGCGVGNPQGHRADWAPRVSRLILFAAVNRGANPKTRRDVWLASILGRAFPPLRRLLIWQIIRGSAFITNLRLEWIRYFASPEVKAPVVVQLVGTEDSLVTRQDSIDIEQFADSYVLDVPGGTHENLYRLDTSDDPETRYALLRDPFVHLRPLKGEDRHFEGPKKVVIIMHGIRANNKTWVTDTKQAIQAKWPDVEPIGVEHEYLSALKFALPMTRRRHLTWFQDVYAEALANNPQAEISFIGHSNGTYLLGESLKSVPGMRFEHAVLAGSVLPRNFDWQTCFNRGQIKRLRVDGSNLDWPVGLLCSALRAVGMGDIGTGGFLGFTDPSVQKQPQVFWYKGGHSAPLGADNLAALAEFAVTGIMIPPPADAIGREVVWFARLGRAMVALGPLIVVGLPAVVVYSMIWGDKTIGLTVACALVAILALLEFN
jgi:pimeloyl-ACP methyl ester carboxylesterase